MILLFIATILCYLFLKLTGGDEEKQLFNENVIDVVDIINKEDSEYDYTKYLKATITDVRFEYNKTSKEQTVDNDFCNIVYRVIIENKAEEPLAVDFRIFTPNELSSTILVGMNYIGPFREYELKPHASIDNEFGLTMKHTDKLNDDEKKLLDQYMKTLYLEVKINGKTYYGKITS